MAKDFSAQFDAPYLHTSVGQTICFRHPRHNIRQVETISANHLKGTETAAFADVLFHPWNITYGGARNLKDKHLRSLAPLRRPAPAKRVRGIVRRCNNDDDVDDDGAEVGRDVGGGRDDGSGGGGGGGGGVGRKG